MATSINKKTLEYLAELSRLDISDKRRATSDKEKKLLKDLQKVLAYFEELKEVNTENIEPMAGGTIEENIFREDEITRNDAEKDAEHREKLINQFPNKENRFLKIPPVFE